MPTRPHRALVVAALLGLALSLLVGSGMPAAAAGGRRVAPASAVWLVQLRTSDRASLPTRRGGLRAGAAAIAKQRAEATGRTITTLEAQVGFSAAMRFTYAAQGFAARLSPAQVRALQADPRVLSLRRSLPVRVADQVVGTGVRRIGAPPGTAPADIDTASVSVAVVDTGISHFNKGNQTWLHADELNIAGGVDAYTGIDQLSNHDRELECADRVSPGQAYDDDYGHGTHVAGIIGARNNLVGAVGVAPGVKLFSVRVFKNGTGSDATVICGLDWIAGWNAAHAGDEPNDIDVVNMSLRGPASTNSKAGCDRLDNPDIEEKAICAVVASGASVVVAAGNETQPVSGFIPSRYASVIAVSALTDFDGQPGGNGTLPDDCSPPRGGEVDDTYAQYSNFGPEVDIIAPGTCIESTDMSRPNGTVEMSGTSMATPHVTGAIARYLAQHPAQDPDMVRARLLASADLGWATGTDPDSRTDRLLDVDAFVSGTPDLALFTEPRVVPVRAGDTEVTVKVSLERIGGFDGAVTMGRGDLPDGVTGVGFSGPGANGLGDLSRTLTIDLGASPPDGERTLRITAAGDQPGDPATHLDLTLRFDGTPPTIGSPWPHITLRTGAWLDRVRVRLGWSASDAQGPLARQEILRALGSGAFNVLARVGAGATTYDTTLERLKKTTFKVKAYDGADNHVLSDPLKVKLLPSQSKKATLSAGWTKRFRSSASNGDLVHAGTAGATATFPFTGRGIAVVAPTGPSKGVIRLRIDGQPAGTVDLGTIANGAKRVVWASPDLAPGPHTLTVTVKAGPVDLDAFLVLG